MRPEVSLSVIVPSLGRSPWQAEMLAALRAELAGRGAELLWVHQGSAPPPELHLPGERLVRMLQPAGFAAAVNAGLAAAAPGSAMIAVVNDDLVVAPGWLATLVEALAARPDAAAVQGVQIELEHPDRIDGCGLGWNRSWQAVQVGGGDAPPALDAAPFEVFGVSATAALYRRTAIVSVARSVATHVAGAALFDERLESYYEDVELAVRLREAGWTSWCIPAARARHAGQGTTRTMPLYRWRAIYRNRLRVVATLCGERFARSVPRLAERDLRDLVRAALRGEATRVVAIVAAWIDFATRGADVGSPERPGAARALAAAERFRIGSRS